MLLSGHARRSRSAAATQRWMVSPRATFGIESAAAVRVCASYRTLPPDENDIEFGNVPRDDSWSSALELQISGRSYCPDVAQRLRNRLRGYWWVCLAIVVAAVIVNELFDREVAGDKNGHPAGDVLVATVVLLIILVAWDRVAVRRSRRTS